MLPRMTPGTWFFMAVLAWIGFNLFWLGVVEKYVPMWVGAIIATLLAIAVFKYGPREKEEEE
ncbi:MAG: hypothetical protein KAV87_36590 [Desulfobacteraceae bacterium]|nr:hypothetical protein [Desulfobacteraceae bacterium]